MSKLDHAIAEAKAHIVRNADKYVENDLTAAEFLALMHRHEAGTCEGKCQFCAVDRDGVAYLQKLLNGELQ